jgi:4-hydroxy-tetrahydrodipicolinate synthase
MALEGILPVIPTPFADGRFDVDSFGRLLDHMLPSTDGYVLLGSTGEAPSMTTRERTAIAAAALEMTPADKAVVVGVTHTALEETLALAEHAQEHGARGVLCAAPFYFANDREGLGSYLRELDAVLDVELVLYDNPAATKTTLPADLVVRWADELEHLGTVKLTDHDLSKVQTWQRAGLRVLAGDDPIAFRYLAAGVDGVVIIAPAVFPEAFRCVWDELRAGHLDESFAIFGTEIAPFLHVFGIGDEIATTKAILADIGVFASGEVRPPLVATPPDRTRLLRIAYDLGVARGAARRNGVALPG